MREGVYVCVECAVVVNMKTQLQKDGNARVI
jgi:hypothetical protein